MKKTVILAALSLLALLIVLPIKRIVNHPLGNPTLENGALRADGYPIPPLPPKKSISNGTSLVADGYPIPPLPPKKAISNGTSLIADGYPIPPLPPKKVISNATSLLPMATRFLRFHPRRRVAVTQQLL